MALSRSRRGSCEGGPINRRTEVARTVWLTLGAGDLFVPMAFGRFFLQVNPCTVNGAAA